MLLTLRALAWSSLVLCVGATAGWIHRMVALVPDAVSADFAGAPLGLGTLVEVRRTALTVNGRPQVDLVLDVETGWGGSFRGTARQVVDLADLAGLIPGTVLPVRCPPDRSDGHVVLAMDAGKEQLRGLAQQILSARLGVSINVDPQATHPRNASMITLNQGDRRDSGMAEAKQDEVWAGRAAGWIRDTEMLDHAFEPFTTALLAAAELPGSRRVLDVGCGAGTLLEEVARHGAKPVGVDISAAMVAAAADRVPSATVVEADAQNADLLATTGGVRFDRVISRFGVMFFEDPVAAFANLHAASEPGARLAFASWRGEESDQFRHGLRALIAKLDQPPAGPVPGRPGPLGLPTEERIREVLTRAGWSQITVEAIDAPCDFGIDGSDGVEERLGMVLNGTIGQKVRAELEPRLGPEGWAAALEEAREELRSKLVDGRVQFPGHTWIVTAVRP